MLLPNDALCEKVVQELATFFDQLNDFEQSFVKSNRTRTYFTEAQKVVVNNLAKKYDLHCMKGYR